MSRFTLAFRCFFRLLFRGQLPASAAEYLPESTPAALPEPPPAAAAEATPEPPPATTPSARPEPKPAAPARKSVEPSVRASEHHRDGALALLTLLQREGRLVDFLRESLDDYQDADIGAAVRDIHRGCKKVLEEHLSIEPVMPGSEDDTVTVPKGFDPGEVRLVGAVQGEPPFQGVLRHHGWRVTKTSLPTLTEGVDRQVLAPAEVEVS